MVQTAEEYASTDAAQRRHVESLNTLEEYVATLREQLADPDGFGGQVCHIPPCSRAGLTVTTCGVG